MQLVTVTVDVVSVVDTQVDEPDEYVLVTGQVVTVTYVVNVSVLLGGGVEVVETPVPV